MIVSFLLFPLLLIYVLGTLLIDYWHKRKKMYEPLLELELRFAKCEISKRSI